MIIRVITSGLLARIRPPLETPESGRLTLSNTQRLFSYY
jgi:hypothetical protein